MRWDDVLIFLAVYESGSAGGAARSLGINQSTVSRRLAALEEQLGARLFDRVPEGLAPTATAEEVFPHAAAMRESAVRFATALDNRDQRVAGTVRVAVFAAVARAMIVPELPGLVQAHPELSIQLVEQTSLSDLVRREADIAVRLVRPQTGELVCQRVAEFGFGVYVSRDGDIDPEGPPALDALRWIAWDDALGFLPEAQWRTRVAADAPVVLTSGDQDTLIEAAAAGLGAAVLPVPLATRHPALVEIHRGVLAELEQPIYLVCHAALRKLPRYDLIWCFLEKLIAQSINGVS